MVKPIIGLILFSLVFVGGAYFVISSGNKPGIPTISYSSQDKEKPVVIVDASYFDMKKIKVSETQEKDFIIKNTGVKPLQLSDISTSCGCTSAQIIYKDYKSKEFSMHLKSDYIVDVAPGTAATVKVTYRPFTMPVYGEVTREVFISTNDPVKPKLVFQVKAFVEK